MASRPGEALAARPLHFIWILDCSGSMEAGGKIQALNNAIHESIPHMKAAASENANAQLLVRVVKFSAGAQWHLSQPTPVETFTWTDLTAGGETDMGKALRLVADALKMPPMPERALPPVLALVSDGQPTDDFGAGLKALNEQPWAKKAVRIAIAIGEDADYDILQRFIGNPEIKVLPANSPDKLTERIRWVSTQVVRAASAPPSQAKGPSSGGGTPIPVPTSTPGDVGDDVW